MTQSHVSQLVVITDAMDPIGLVSKRGIARLLLEDGSPRASQNFHVNEACSYSYQKIRSDLSFAEAARLFETENASCAIVSDDEQISGIQTETDLCQYFSLSSPRCLKVSDFMRTAFAHAKSTYPIIHVAHMIVSSQASIPVIDEKLVGILTLSDFLSMTDGGLDHDGKGGRRKKA